VTASTRCARPAAGAAGGALGGMYPDPSFGSPSSAGYRIADEFLKPPVGTVYGDLDWTAIVIGSAPTCQAVTPTADTEYGIARLATNVAAALDEGGMLGWPVAGGRQFSAIPQVGAYYTAKLSTTTHLSMRIFSGLIQNQAPWWAGANDCIGFKAENAGVGSNWVGVVRRGAVQTVVDLGVACDSTWQTLRWRREIDESGNDGIQFYVATQPTGQHNYHYPVIWTAVGSLVTANFPTNALTFCPAGIATRVGAVVRSVDIDYMDFGGPGRRV